LESVFIRIGDKLISIILVCINLFSFIFNISNFNSEHEIDNDYSSRNFFRDSSKDSSEKSQKNINKFSFEYLKSLFFKDDVKEDFIFKNLDNNYSYNLLKPKSVGPNFKFNSKFDIKSENSISLDNNYEKDIFKEVISSKILFNLKSISKISLYLIFILILIIGLISYFVSFEIGLSVLMIVALLILYKLFVPKIKNQNKVTNFSSELPYALLQLATELKSGKSLFNSLESVVDADYGVLSLEFSRVLEEIKYGETTEDAFLRLESRINSKALSRVIREILSTLRIGGNLANSLIIISEDINFEMRMKLKDYAQRLNAFIMIYTFVAILAPVVFLTLLLAASTVMGDIIPADFLLIMYGVLFPMIIIFLAVMIKKLEPKI
ncbi:MAG: type II secretion system F family protein, partial [archaeon]|nr:type II secretion system F family protein [archaeon]